MPELVLAPIGRPPQIQTVANEPEPLEQPEESNERATQSELDEIARNVYHILKRRLARERERALGVI